MLKSGENSSSRMKFGMAPKPKPPKSRTVVSLASASYTRTVAAADNNR